MDSRLVFIVGRNAAGKTNILEAISILSNGKSFRGAQDRDIVQFGRTDYFLSSTFKRFDKSFKIELGCDVSQGSGRKKIKLNGKLVPGRSGLIGNLITVIFSPSDIQIVEGGPQHRRRFLDSVLSNQNHSYLLELMQFNRALKQRNAILKKIRERKASTTELEIWNQGFIKSGEIVIRERERFINEFRYIFLKSLKWISTGIDEIDISLVYSKEGEKEDLAGTLRKNMYADISAGFTVTGPHRHNLAFMNNGKDIMTFGSQGQKRTISLALRIAEFYFLKQNLNISPLLLIDDVIRELDAQRRSAFIELLRECGQAVFTTPDLDGLEEFLNIVRSDSLIYEVKGNGVVVKQ